MATSGSRNHITTRSEIVADAFSAAGVYYAGESIDANDSTLANRLLNHLVKAWDSAALRQWTMGDAVLYLEKGVSEYVLSDAASSAYWSDSSVETQLTSAHSASATELSVDSTSGMTASDNVGIVTSDKTIHWTTIVSVDDSTTLTITSGLDSAASDNGRVFTFTDRASNPLRVYYAERREEDAGTNDSQMQVKERKEYFALSNKTVESFPTEYNFTPGRDAGKFLIYPTPSDAATRIVLHYQKRMEDLDANSDNPDLPQAWYLAIVYHLAVLLCPHYGKKDKIMELSPIAQQYYQLANEDDQEPGSIRFTPNGRGTY